ncbi:hypothetical protein F4774DRAFT_424234 [Daldinia eschscholtzii]|nr:hypothetical protein F4774DRAFT_424234 [Daldinia eschscholtzii]
MDREVWLSYPGTMDNMYGVTACHRYAIVAVHGLGAHPYYSWKANGPAYDSATEQSKDHDVEINWLKHEGFLKEDFKNARILSYGYNADWFMDASLSTASQKAMTFLKALAEFRQETKKTPPILFIGHSFGGIIVKYAIHFAYSDSCFEDINRNTAGIIFLGTPHQGSGASSFGKALARLTSFSGSNAMLLRLLSYGSPALLDLKRDFSTAITSIFHQKPLLVYSFYETLPTFFGWLSLGVIVGPHSATLDIGKHISVDTNHSGLNKCKAKTDQPYIKISSAIREIQSILRRDSEPIAKWIMGSDDPARIYRHKEDHERARGKLRAYDNLGKWLIESPEFKVWSDIEGRSSPTFWLCGGVGTGKTSVSSEVIEWFSKDNRLRESRKIVYAYCSQDHDLDSMRRSLILQLAISVDDGSVQRLISNRYYSRGDARKMSLHDESSGLLSKLCGAYSEVIIMIDALDECPSPIKTMDMLKKIQGSSSNKVKLFLSSRLDAQINDVFSDLRCLTIDAIMTSSDLEQYINRETDSRLNTPPGWIEEGFKDRFKRALSECAQGVFRWVELQIEIFFDETYPFDLKQDVDTELQNLENGRSITGNSDDPMVKLNQAYHRILKRRRGNARSLIEYALKWVLYSQEPIGLADLVEAVALSHRRVLADQHCKALDSKNIIQLCSNLISFDGPYKLARLSHHSVKEYLMNSKYCSTDYDHQECHGFIAEICLRYIYENTSLRNSYICSTAFSHYSLAGPTNRGRKELRNLLDFICEQRNRFLDGWNASMVAKERVAKHYYSSAGKLCGFFFAACVYNLEDVLELSLIRGSKFADRQQILRIIGLDAAIRCDSHEVVLDLVKRLEATARLVRVVLALGNQRAIELILQKYGKTGITPDMVMCAAKNNKWSGIEALELLKRHFNILPANLVTFDWAKRHSETLKYLLAEADYNTADINGLLELLSYNHEELMSIIWRSKGGIPITQDVLLAAARNSHHDGHRVMEFLLDNKEKNINVTEEILCAAASNESNGLIILKSLFGIQQKKPIITEEILCAAASNKYKEGAKIFLYLLGVLGDSVNITDKIVCAIASNTYQGAKIFQYLWKASGVRVNITEAALLVMANHHCTFEDFIKILEHLPGITISETLITDAFNTGHSAYCNRKFIETLFSYASGISFSEEILVAITRRFTSTTEVMNLFTQYEEQIQITPSVLAGAATNESIGDELVKQLLARKPDLSVNNIVLEAAARNRGIEEESMKMLLDHKKDTQIENSIMEALAYRASWRPEEIYELFLEHSPNIKISVSALEAAATSKNYELLEIWLSRGDVTITPKLLEIAAGSRLGIRSLPMLLDYDKRCQVTGAALIAAIRTMSQDTYLSEPSMFDSTFQNMLKRAGTGITEDVLESAAETDFHGRHITKVLLEHEVNLGVRGILKISARNDSYTYIMFKFLLDRDRNCQIMEDVVVAAAQSSGGSLLALLDCGRPVPISPEVLKTAVSRRGGKAASNMAHILHSQPQIKITDEVMQITRKRYFSGHKDDDENYEEVSNAYRIFALLERHQGLRDSTT